MATPISSEADPRGGKVCGQAWLLGKEGLELQSSSTAQSCEVHLPSSYQEELWRVTKGPSVPLGSSHSWEQTVAQAS